MLQSIAVSNGRYFPMRLLSLTKQTTSEIVHVKEILVKQLAADKPIDREALRFRVPAGTTVMDATPTSGLNPFIRLKQDESIGPSEIPALMKMVEVNAHRAPGSPRTDTAVATYTTPSSKNWLYFVQHRR